MYVKSAQRLLELREKKTFYYKNRFINENV